MKTNTSHPSISIVTPSFNQAWFLGEALRSVHEQEYPVHEHLVFDGGSSDHSTTELEDFQHTAHGHRLTWISERDGGQSAALNQGFAQATGDIIGWLNADDRYRPGCFEQVARIFAEHPEIDILYGDYTKIDASGNHVSLQREIEFSRFILRHHRVLCIPTTSTFFRRRIFDDGHFLREDLHYVMDLEFFLRLSNAGYRFQHIAHTLADFRLHADSKTVRYKYRQSAEHRRILIEASSFVRILPTFLHAPAISALQVPAGFLRYFEKLLRGFYFPVRRPRATVAQMQYGRTLTESTPAKEAQ